MKTTTVIFLILISCTGLNAQSGILLSANSPLTKTVSTSANSSGNFLVISPAPTYPENFQTPAPAAVFPSYIQDNPQGFSYLCSLELEVEKKLPVGIWVKFGEEVGMNERAANRASVRLRF